MNDILLDCKKTIGVFLTGGGTKFLTDLLCRGGMSPVFLGAEIPYSEVRLNEIVEHKHYKEKAVSEFVATAGAVYISETLRSNIGIGVTASLFCYGQRIDRLNHAYIHIYGSYDSPTSYFMFKASSVSGLSIRESQEHALSYAIYLSLLSHLDKLDGSIALSRDMLNMIEYTNNKYIMGLVNANKPSCTNQ